MLKETSTFATIFSQRPTVMAYVLAAALLGPIVAGAQQFSVGIIYQFQRAFNTSFAVEMELGPDGHLRGTITPQDPDIRVAGTHSALRATAEGLHATFGTRWTPVITDTAGKLEDGGGVKERTPVQDPVFVIIGSAPHGSSGGARQNTIVFDIVDSVDASAAPNRPEGSGGSGQYVDMIIFDIVAPVDASTAFSIRIEAQPDQQLQGSPAHLFNRPGPGEPLIATIPALEPGGSLEEVLTVHDANAPYEPRTLIPVKIKHNL